jgi:DNA primase
VSLWSPSDSMRKSLALRHKTYRDQLKDSAGVPYLEGRGITTATADYFQLGFVGNPLPGDERYQDRLCIPYLTISGTVQLRFRAVKDHGPKYLGDHGMKGRPFNTTALMSSDPTVYITEGEIDAITAWQCGMKSVVGFPGADSWMPLFKRLFRYRKVVVLADGDTTIIRDNATAGQLFAHQIARAVEECKIIEMPPGEDVNSFFLAHGEDALREKVGLERRH